MFGIAIIPLMGAVGAAVDYTQANATRTQFQNALDATALMLSNTAALQSAADLQAAATTDFNALFTNTNAKNVTVTAAYSIDQRIATRAQRQRHHPNEFSQRPGHRYDQYHRIDDIDLG